MNKTKLKAYAIMKNCTLGTLAENLGINPATLHRKMTGESDFTRAEIQIVQKALRLTIDEVEEIFFDDELA